MTAELAVITGLSGAGRTTAAKVLEDIGYFVIDNLPSALIGKVVDLVTAPGSTIDRVALVADVRGGRASSRTLEESTEELRAAIGGVRGEALRVRVVFLEAGDDALVKRYEAARRAHPLAEQGRIVDGIARERDLLRELQSEADLVVDTTDLNVHGLRDRLVDAFGEGTGTGLVCTIVSFGFKHGTPRDADLLFDVRFLPNPHWVEDLRPHTGLDAPVRDYVLGMPDTRTFLERVNQLLDFLVPAYEGEGKHYLTIGIGCTGGQHRSVVLGEVLADHLRTLGVIVRVDHRDIDRR